MLSTTFVGEITANKSIEIPPQMLSKLGLKEGDKVEVLIKRIRSRRLDIRISRNPLLKLLTITADEKQS